MNPIQQINRVMLLALAPFLGALGFLAAAQLSVELPKPVERPQVDLQLRESSNRR